MDKSVHVREQASCDTCRWCGLRSGMAAQAALVCRFNPPVAHPMMQMTQSGPSLNMVTMWPAVEKSDYCSRFERQSQ